MTPKQYRSLARYMAVIANEFGLRDWDVTLHAEEPGDGNDGGDALASVECVYGRRKAHIRVASAFDEVTPEEQRNAVLHELIHIHTEPMRALLRTTLPKIMGLPAFETFWPAFTQADEHATDAIAAAIGDKYPLWEG